MIAFERAFFIAGLLFVASVPLLLLLDEGPRKGSSSPAPGTAPQAHEAREPHAVEI